MGRSGYSEDIDDQWAYIRWRGRVASAAKGKRGQALFRALLETLDHMPDKRLIAEEMTESGAYCTLGALGHQRGMDVEHIDPYDHEALGRLFDVAPCLTQEIMFMNDDWLSESPEERWQRMRNWVASQIKQPSSNEAET